MNKILFSILGVIVFCLAIVGVSAVAPTVSNLKITPSEPITTNNLVASYDFSDADGDSEGASEVIWYKNNAIVGEYNNKTTVLSSATKKGESWRFEVKAIDAKGDAAVAFVSSGAVVIKNSAPVLDAIGNREAYNDIKIEIVVSATDPDQDVLVYDVINLPTGANFDKNTRKFGWTPTEEQRGKHENIEFKVSDGSLEDSENITITVLPSYCDAGDKSNIEIGNIDFPSEKYKPGDTVNVVVEDVKAGTDIEEIGVEVCLYNVDKDEEIDCWEAEGEESLADDEKEDYSVSFKIPNDENIGKGDNYLLIASVKADEEDTGDSQCVQKSKIIRISRDTHSVVVSEVSVIPSSLSCGDTAEVKVVVENQGTSNEEDVYIVLKSSELGIDLDSNKFELDKYSGSDETASKRFTIAIPENAKDGEYNLEAVVYFKDGEETKNGFGKLTVSECGVTPVTPVKGAKLSLTSDAKLSAKNNRVNLHFIVTSNEESDLDATIEMSSIGDWAEPILPQQISLHPGENNYYLDLVLKEGVEDGMRSATVTVKPVGNSQFEAKQFSLNFEVSKEVAKNEEGKLPSFKGVTSSNLFWIIGDVVLVIIALFFIKAIFFGRKSQ